MKQVFLKEEDLELVSGGYLKEGWDTTLLNVMVVYKKKYGEDGKQRVVDMMRMSVNDPTSTVTVSDLKTINEFIDKKWPTIKVGKTNASLL